MKRLFSSITAAFVALAMPTHASLLNIEYTITPPSGGGGEALYTFQLWVDLNDQSYIDGMGFESIIVGGFTGSSANRVFEFDWLTPPSGFTTTGIQGQLSGQALVFGVDTNAAFYVPTAGDFSFVFTGSTARLDAPPVLFRYRSINDPSNPLQLDSGTLTASAVNALTNLNGMAPVPLPAALPLLVAGLGGLVVVHRTGRRKQA